MGKKKLRSKYTSKGERRSVNKKVCNALARDVSRVDRLLNAQAEWAKGKTTSNPWVTVPNPDPNNTKARMIRVRARDLWGDPKHNFFKFGGSSSE